MIRTFDRIDKLPEWVHRSYNIRRAKGKYIDIAKLYETPRRLCALASRLTHESWEKSTPDSDFDLLNRLHSMGDEHGKSLRGHQFYLLIEAPRYWWAECDTYTVGSIGLGSTSTMYKEAKKLKGDELIEVKSNLPEGTLQLRARVFSEPTLIRMASQRDKHRLPEWHEFSEFVRCIIRDSSKY